MQDTVHPTGVVIPQLTVEESNTKKSKGKKTLAQLPVYRAAANLKYIVTTLMAKSPRSLTKFFDQMLGTVSEIKKSIGMASISRNPEERAWYLDCARYANDKRYCALIGMGEGQNIYFLADDEWKTIRYNSPILADCHVGELLYIRGYLKTDEKRHNFLLQVVDIEKTDSIVTLTPWNY